MALPTRSRGRSSLGTCAATRGGLRQHQRAGGVEVERGARPGSRDHAPPTAGPTARAKFIAMALSVTAAASSPRGTISRTLACQAGPVRAVPTPIRKVKSRSVAGVTRLRPLNQAKLPRSIPSRTGPEAGPDVDPKDRQACRRAAPAAGSACTLPSAPGPPDPGSRRAWSSARPHPRPGLWCPSH